MKLPIIFYKNKRTNSYLTIFIFIFIFIFLVSYSCLKYQVLPLRFFFDTHNIIAHIMFDSSFDKGDSYSNTASFYKFFGIRHNNFLFDIFSAFILIKVYFDLLIRDKASITLFELFLFFVYLFLSITYLTMLSKDFLVFLILIPFYYYGGKKIYRLIPFVILAILYGVYFRAYWLLVMFVFFIIYMGTKIVTCKKLFFICCLVLLFLTITFNYILHVDVNYYRELVNLERIENGDDNAATMINPIIDSSNILFQYINIVLVWLSLIIPIPIFLKFSPYYFFIAFIISALTFKIIKKIKYDNFFTLKERTFISLIVSFILIQSIFEPDYGSFVRHLSPFYPIIFYLISNKNSNKNEYFN